MLSWQAKHFKKISSNNLSSRTWQSVKYYEIYLPCKIGRKIVKFVSCVVPWPVDVSSLPSLLSNVTWVAIRFINDFGGFIWDDTFCASFLFCILTSVHDIEWLGLCNADTTSLFPVWRWATIPKLKKIKKNKNSWKKNN